MKKLIMLGIITVILAGCGGGAQSVDQAISQVDKVIEKIEKKKGNMTEEDWRNFEKEAEQPMKVISDALENDKVGAMTKLKLIAVAGKWATTVSKAGLIEFQKQAGESLKELEKSKEGLGQESSNEIEKALKELEKAQKELEKIK